MSARKEFSPEEKARLAAEQQERHDKHAAAQAAAAPLRAWHAQAHRSRVLTEEEGRLLEYGDAPQLGLRPAARMTIATRAFWSIDAAKRAELLAAAPAELDAEGRELHVLKSLYDLVSDEVPENHPTDLIACNAHVAKVLELLFPPPEA